VGMGLLLGGGFFCGAKNKVDNCVFCFRCAVMRKRYRMSGLQGLWLKIV